MENVQLELGQPSAESQAVLPMATLGNTSSESHWSNHFDSLPRPFGSILGFVAAGTTLDKGTFVRDHGWICWEFVDSFVIREGNSELAREVSWTRQTVYLRHVNYCRGWDGIADLLHYDCPHWSIMSSCRVESSLTAIPALNLTVLRVTSLRSSL